MASDATLERLKQRMVEWMRLRGQGPDWTIEGRHREVIDFSHEYEVIPKVYEIPMRVFLRQWETTVVPSQSWINVSDMFAAKLGLPKGTLFRIFPVVGTVDNQDAEDFAYSIVWEAEKQYWFDIVYDPAKDLGGLARQVLMVDSFGRVNSFVVPHNAIAQDVEALWRRVIDAPDNVGISVTTGDNEVFHWGYSVAPNHVAYAIETPSARFNVDVFPGNTQFQADQISRLLDVKLPPLIQAKKTKLAHAGFKLQFDEDPLPLGLRLMATHIFSWNLEGTIMRDVAPMDLWLPYDQNLIMRRGHQVDTAIPEDPAEAEFPDLSWSDEVMILIKSHARPSVPPARISASGPPSIPPSSWIGPALGTAPPISSDAAAVTTYASLNTGQDGTTIGDLPIDPSLLQLRGLSKADTAVHKMISWTSRKDYPSVIGISLPIAD
jgi:hypothetical protein